MHDSVLSVVLHSIPRLVKFRAMLKKCVCVRVCVCVCACVRACVRACNVWMHLLMHMLVLLRTCDFVCTCEFARTGAIARAKVHLNCVHAGFCT